MDSLGVERFGFLDLGTARRLLTRHDGSWPDGIDDEELARDLSRLCRIQRVYEKHIADPKFRAAIATDAAAVLVEHGVDVPAEELASLWGPAPSTTGVASQPTSLSPILSRFIDFRERRARAREFLSVAGEIREPRMKAWWLRQRARTATQFEPIASRHILHAPICFELSKGCSVGCWFCNVEAPRFSASFPFSDDNAKLWREVLTAVGDLLGPSAQAGFCYCATDPFDNPDYERFLLAYHEVLGVWPQTTTALALKDTARTAALLRLAGDKGCGLNRFSVLSLGQLERIHAAFRPEELAFAGLVMQNREASQAKANAGRARLRKRDREPLAEGSASCVSGFVVNLVERTVQLISPCPAEDRWPQGHIVFAEGRFENAATFRALLDRMIDEHMPLAVEGERRLAFRPDLRYSPVDEGFQLGTRFTTLKFGGDVAVRRLGDLVHEGRRTAAEIAGVLEVCGMPSVAVTRSLQSLHDRGVLEEAAGRLHLPLN